jgi:FYVE zinc finger
VLRFRDRSSGECLKLEGTAPKLQMDNVFQRGQWMDDSESDSCLECNSSFSLLLRRHHCRRCGSLFCDNCTSKRILIPDALFVVPPNSLFHESDSSVINRCCGPCTILVANYRSPQSLISALPITVPSSNLCESNGSLYASNLSTYSVNQQHTTPASTSIAAALPPDVPSTRIPLREIDCLEWRGGSVGAGRFKMYSITVPSSISKSRRFQVSLDNRVMTVVLPLDIVPGQRILVKAPSPSVSVQRAQAVTVLAPTKKVQFPPLSILTF